MKKVLLALLVFLSINNVHAQGYRWATRLGGAQSDFGRDIAVDNNGNVLTTGTFQLSMTLTTAEGTGTLTSLGGSDIYVTKSGPNGNYLWIRKIGGTSSDEGISMTVDASGNIYVTGFFQSTVDFDPGAGTTNLTSFGGMDIFVLKLDPNGQFLWVKQLGGTTNEKATSIMLDANDNILLTGTYEGTADFDPGVGTANLSSLGAQDVFICKLNTSGDYVWANTVGNSTNLDQASCIAVDQNDDVYITGQFYGTVDFDPGAGNTSLTATGIYDAYILKLTANGLFSFVKKIAGANISASASGTTIDIDGNGNILTTGSFQNTCDFDPSAGVFSISATGLDNYICKFDNTGNLLWAKHYSGSGQRTAFGLELDQSNNCYIAGSFENTTDFDPGSGVTNKTSAGTRDIYITKLTPAGELIWAHALGSTGMDQAFSITTDAAENVYATGYFFNTVDFNPGQGVNTLTNSGGNGDVFILKLGYCEPDTVTDVQSTCGPFTWINGVTYTTSNSTASHLLTNVGGCDSLIYLNLTINTPTSSTDTITACESFTWINGITYTSSNTTATHTISNIHGCDSVITLHLTITHQSTSTDIQASCGPYTWIDGNTYYTSNSTATVMLTNAAGCDSIVTLQLTINEPVHVIQTVTTCDSYTWINGTTYTSSTNTPTHLLTRANGCDSLLQLDLTIHSSSSSTQNVTSCGSYTWINCVTYTTSTTATHTLTNYLGCDSVITLNLTILPESYTIETISSCGPYTWIDGNMYTSSNNTATHTLINYLGCDSIITLNLTILPESNTIETISSCGPFTWIDGNTYASSNNTATHTLTNVAGCDSVITLNLTVLPENSTHHVIQTCGPYTWIDGNTYNTSTTTPSYLLQNSSGCDSIIYLDLTVTSIDPTVTENSGILTANQANAIYQWIDCSTGAPIPGETGQTFTVQNAGSYAVRINSGNCTEISACIPVQAQHLNESQLPEITVFPNPVFDLLTITTEAAIDVIRVYNSAGQLVLTSNETTFSTAQLAAGVYHLKITTQNGSVSKQFIKE